MARAAILFNRATRCPEQLRQDDLRRMLNLVGVLYEATPGPLKGPDFLAPHWIRSLGNLTNLPMDAWDSRTARHAYIWLCFLRGPVEGSVLRRYPLRVGEVFELPPGLTDKLGYSAWRVQELDGAGAFLTRGHDAVWVHSLLAGLWLTDPVARVEEFDETLPLSHRYSPRLVSPALGYRGAVVQPQRGQPATHSLGQHFQGNALWGWIQWTICAERDTVLSLSYVYPPFLDIWLWNIHIAADCLPCSLHLDCEGYQPRLTAFIPADDPTAIGISFHSREDEVGVVIVRMPRENWVRQMGQVFQDFFAADYIPYLWETETLGQDQPEYLPWHFPAALYQARPAYSPLQNRAQLWLRLAWWSHRTGGSGCQKEIDEASRRARYQGQTLNWALFAWLSANDLMPETPTPQALRNAYALLPEELRAALEEGDAAIRRFKAEVRAYKPERDADVPDLARLNWKVAMALAWVTRRLRRYWPALPNDPNCPLAIASSGLLGGGTSKSVAS
ncbi:MAG: hypothetical protein HZB71_09815 [Betaproteobacteria bacterium]|nr:hypothetical protein [Betaproteobacteria bacterium]